VVAKTVYQDTVAPYLPNLIFNFVPDLAESTIFSLLLIRELSYWIVLTLAGINRSEKILAPL
jgi:hypothetical protein